MNDFKYQKSSYKQNIWKDDIRICIKLFLKNKQSIQDSFKKDCENWTSVIILLIMIFSITKRSQVIIKALLCQKSVSKSQILVAKPKFKPTQLQIKNDKRLSINSLARRSLMITSYFCTNKNSQNPYQNSDSNNKSRKQETTIEGQTKSSRNFIVRLREYSNFLSKQNIDLNKSFISGEQMQKKLVNQIDVYLQEAGTTAKQISESLADIANKLELILNQNIKLCSGQPKNQQQAQKFKVRHEQFMKLLEKLDKEYYKQPNITSVQPIQATLFILDLQTQMTSLIQLLYGAIEDRTPYFKFTPDITNDDPFNKNFDYAWDKVKIISLDSATKARHDMVYNLLKKSVIMVTSAVVTEHTWSKWNNQYWHKLLFGLSFPVSLTNLQKAELKCYKMWRRPSIELSKNLLDLPQKGYIQHAKKIIYPRIKSNFFLYTHSAPESTVENKQSVKSEQVKAEQTNVNIFQKAENSGRILLNYHEDIHFKQTKPEGKFSALKNIFHTQRHKNQGQVKDVENVIIHIHGGGFISMSSELMQNHTRLWANELQIPVFSLDYRKPPQHRFPEPVQDCVAGYKFIVENIHNYMNIRPKNIIVAGDSAGGNLACALNASLMKQKYPILPKALFLMYPAVDLRIRYTASRLHSFDDGIFSASFLMLCQIQYLGKDRKNQFDPLASPILLKQSYINPEKSGTTQGQKWPLQWPQTIIMAGRKDPLFDDSIRLVQRLARDKIDCKLLLYKDFSHGFMSMDQILPGGKSAIQDSINELKNIVKGF